MVKVYRGDTYIDVELPKGYSILPLFRNNTPITERDSKYAVYHHSNLIGLVFAARVPITDTYEYTLTKWDHSFLDESSDIQKLLTNICAQHKMGLIK